MTRRRLRRRAWVASSVLIATGVVIATLLGGCVLPPKDSRREPSVESRELGLTAAEVTPAGEQWWQALDDAQLDALIAQALAANPSLIQATAQLRAAQAAVDASSAGLYPRAKLSGIEQIYHVERASADRVERQQSSCARGMRSLRSTRRSAPGRAPRTRRARRRQVEEHHVEIAAARDAGGGSCSSSRRSPAEAAEGHAAGLRPPRPDESGPVGVLAVPLARRTSTTGASVAEHAYGLESGRLLRRRYSKDVVIGMWLEQLALLAEGQLAHGTGQSQRVHEVEDGRSRASTARASSPAA